MAKIIKSPCVKCRPVNSNSEFVYATGYSHSDCYDFLHFAHNMYALANPYDYECVEGFVCDDDSFVDRVEAKSIAIESGQIKKMYIGDDYPLLKSYMLNTYA